MLKILHSSITQFIWMLYIKVTTRKHSTLDESRISNVVFWRADCISANKQVWTRFMSNFPRQVLLYTITLCSAITHVFMCNIFYERILLRMSVLYHFVQWYCHWHLKWAIIHIIDLASYLYYAYVGYAALSFDHIDVTVNLDWINKQSGYETYICNFTI